jgi:AcrR family transcriptional regulator
MGTGDRSRVRREALKEAARRAVVEHGTNVRLVQVAQAAGVTSGAVLYHYPDLDQLLLEAQHAGMERFYEARRAAVADVVDPVRALVSLVHLGLPAAPDDPDVRLLCELGGSAGRDHVIATLLTSLYDRQVSLYESVVDAGRRAGVFRPSQPVRTIARTIVALEDAYGYRIVARHPTLDYDAAVALVLDYARLATGHPLPVGSSTGEEHAVAG